jgi:hypothetical protein
MSSWTTSLWIRGVRNPDAGGVTDFCSAEAEIEGREKTETDLDQMMLKSCDHKQAQAQSARSKVEMIDGETGFVTVIVISIVP